MEEREIHLRDYLKIIDKRRYIILTFFFITFAVVLIGTFTATPIYRASAKVLIEKNAPEMLLDRYAYNSYDPEFLETQYQLIKSRHVAQRVVEMLSLDRSYSNYVQDDRASSPLEDAVNWGRESLAVLLKIAGINNGAQEEDEESPGAAEDRARSEADMLAMMISSGVQVAPVGNSRVVTISFESPSPALAQVIVNTVAQAYMQEILEIKMNTSGQTVKWMTEKADEERESLARAEQALQEYSKNNDIVTVEDRIAIIPQKLAEFSSELSRAEARRKELQALINRIDDVISKNGDLEAISFIASDPAVQSVRSQIAQSGENKIELSKKYGPKHPVMERAESELAVLDAKKKQEIARVIESNKNEYALAKSREDDLRQLLSRTKDEAISLNEKFIQYGLLKREVESNQLLFDALIRKIKEQGVTEQNQPVTVWMSEKASLPLVPARPRKKANIMLGILVGLFGGIGFAFFVEYLDNTIKSPDEAESKLGVTVLGIVERYRPQSKEDVIELAIQNDSMSTFAESYKAIRSAILLASANKPPKRILVSSTSVQEGKTTTAANLAMTIAQLDYRVLLIDADLRRPTLHKFFGIDNFKGLSTYLCGISDNRVATTLSEKNLTIIPSGPIPPNPSELLSSARVKELLAGYADYDFIIMDSPPLLNVTDSLILHRLADATILVSRYGQTTIDACTKALKLLKDVKASTLGLIINAMDIKKGRYYYNYGYYHSEYYTAEYVKEENIDSRIDRRRRSNDRRKAA